MIRFVLVILTIVLYLIFACLACAVFFFTELYRKHAAKKNPELLNKPSLKDRASRKMVQGVFRVVLFISGVKVKVEGLEKLHADQSVLYIGNHRSFFDIVISYTLFPNITGFVAKKELEKVPLLSVWMRYIHCLFLDRENIKEGLKTILAGIAEIKNGVSLCIYPEGTRSREASELDMLEFKEGSLKIAEKGGCPVVPIAMLHTADAWENHFPRIKPTNVLVRIGDPIDLKALDKETKKRSGAYVREILLQMLADMKQSELA